MTTNKSLETQSHAKGLIFASTNAINTKEKTRQSKIEANLPILRILNCLALNL